MIGKTAEGRQPEPVKQFSVFTANRLGRLNDLIASFRADGLTVLGMTVLDTTDSSIIRLVVDDPDKASCDRASRSRKASSSWLNFQRRGIWVA